MTEAQSLAEAAGFKFDIPASTRALVGGELRLFAPQLERFGKFSLYLFACIAEASARDIHRGTVSSRYADPIAARVMLLADALHDPHDDRRAIGLSVNLLRFLSDIEYASRRDPDQARRLEFAAALYNDVADQFDKFRLPAWAEPYREKARRRNEAMRKMNEATIAAE